MAGAVGEGEHELWMGEALREAEKALDEGEVPVGCVFVHKVTRSSCW